MGARWHDIITVVYISDPVPHLLAPVKRFADEPFIVVLPG